MKSFVKIALLLAFAAVPGWGSVTIDANTSKDLSAASTQITTPAFSTTAPDELLLAFVATDAQSGNMIVASVSGGGLTWELVARANTSSGTSEIWRAFSFSTLTNASVTANLSQSVIGSLVVMSFSGVDNSGVNGSGAIGATATASALSGAPTASLTTTRANSWVFGVGNDFDRAVARTLGPGQTLIHQDLSPTHDTYWMQRQNSTTPASGTKVTINDTAPTGDRFNLAICEILPPSGTVAPAISSLTPNAGVPGTSVVIAGSNFGASKGNGGVTFNGMSATVVSWSASSVTALVPYGATPGNVVVTASNGLSSNGLSFTASLGSGGLAIDAKAYGDLLVPGTSLSTQIFSTTSSNELLLALIATDGLSAGMKVNSVSGGGLTWVLVNRTNTQSGDTEIWRAFAPSTLANVQVTATLAQSVVGSIQVLGFTGVDTSGTNGSGAIGAVGSGNGNPGAPTANLTTTRANSWVFGVGNDYDNSITRVVGAGQTIIHQHWSSTNDTYWMQRLNNTTAASGTVVTINDTAPTKDRYNLSLVEVLPSNGAAAAPVITGLSPNAGPVGTVVTISGSNFGPAQGANTVTFGGISATVTSSSSTSIVAAVPAGLVPGPVPVVVAVNGAGTSNAATFTVVAPLAIAAVISPSPNANGWNNTNVTVSYSCSGGVSPVQCPAPVTVVTEGANQIITATATDANGSHAAVSVTLNIDKTAPTITAAVAPPAANGIVTAPATITFTCSDGLSGIASCPGPIAVTTPGSQTFSGTATDRAGNTATASLTLKVETAPLAVNASASPLPNINTWNNSNVIVSFVCTGGVPPVQCPSSQTISVEGANQNVTATATDAAGQAASASTIVNIDKTAPTITGQASPAPNAQGWNNTPVTVSFQCNDALSGLAGCGSSVFVSTEGANQPITSTARDQAGNSATSTPVSVSIDLAPPTITASITPAPNPLGINTGSATVIFTCSDSLSGILTCPAPVTVTTPGLQTVAGTAVDKAGNTAASQVSLKIQSAPLQITTSVSPAPNAAGWNNTPVTVSFLCTGGVAPVQCPASRTVNTDGANQRIHGTATDAAGITASTFATVNLDQTPPALSVTSPIGNNVTTAQTSLQGLVSDALSGTKTVTCNGIAATVSVGAFSCNLTLAPGTNAITIAAADIAGNTANTNASLNLVTPIHLHITAPASQQLFSSNPITVTGTVDNANAAITVGGITATVSNGVFTASGVTLRESVNLLTANATSLDGGVGSDTVTVFLDTTPPVIHIDSPPDGASVTTPQIDVSGNVNDSVTGTVNPDQVSVAVNGVTADVANRSFAGHNILLVPGVNTITAVATDRAGNISQHQIRVTLQQTGALQAISVVSGNNQRAPIRTVLPSPMVVQATDAIGRPLANVPLSFSVSKSDGLLISGQQQGRALTVQTDVNGKASVQFRLGSRNGMAVNQVTVSAPGFVGQPVFSADSTVGAATQIHTVSGELQTGAIEAALPEPLTAIVSDSGGNPVPNVPVLFTVRSGGGLIAGQPSFTVNTDNDGRASAVLVLGQQEGISNNVVTASFAGLAGQAAVFRSSGIVPGPAANTTVSGIVLDDANEPIVNATASIKGTNLSALTNASGRFTIADAPVGDIVLFVDGSTSTDPESYPTLSFQMATISGIDNTLPGPIFLPELDSDNSQVVGGDQDVVLTMKNVPGVEYKVFAHSVTFPDGSHTGRLTLSQVHGDRVPMTPPNGTAPRLVGTLQPAGVKFDPPIQMTLPNTDGLAPGQVTEIFSFHHDVEQFVVEGTARVSSDGSVVVTDPGFGLTVSGWHGGGGTPPPPTCADGCDAGDTCQIGSCQDGACDFTDEQDGVSCSTDDACLVHGTCSGGSCSGDQIVITSVDPLADGASPDATAVNQTVNFTATVTQQNCDQLTYSWDFGDGSSSSDQNPTHQYTSEGKYTATVTVTCGDCDESQSNDVEVDVVKADVNINGTADTGDDITVLNPPLAIPVQIQLHGGPATVKLKVEPAGRATLDRDTLNLPQDGSDTVTLTPVVVSGAVDDVTITATVNGNQVGTGHLTIADVKIPAIRNSDTPAGMPDRIPPRVDTPIHITVAPDLGTSGKKVHLILKNNNATNGDLTIDGGTTKDLTTTADVPMRGTVQTSPGNAGHINVVAQVRGQDAVTSNGFSVAAIPQNFSEALVSTVNFGIRVSASWQSDSTNPADLDQVQFSEQVQVDNETGSLVGLGGGQNSHYLPMPLTGTICCDTHGTPPALITAAPGTQQLSQTHTLKDARTGVTDIPIANSGYHITRTVTQDPTTHVLHLTTAKAGAATSANGFASGAGAGGGSATQP